MYFPFIACVALISLLSISAKFSSPVYIVNKNNQKNNEYSLIASTETNSQSVLIASKQSGMGALLTGLLSGAFAGITTDIILFPIDTIKTRLQSKAGITFSLDILANMYKGILPALAASAPCAATFFGAYDYLERTLSPKFSTSQQPAVHFFAACGGNLAQSVVRVPFEVIKQRLQAGVDSNALTALAGILKSQGIKGLYKGWGALAARDLPFDTIQFPLYEFLKVTAKKTTKRDLYSWESSLCGSIAGGFTAAITTPLDVIKTRIMTSPENYSNMVDCFAKIIAKEGPQALFAGVVPRVVMISIGGAIFFGALETARNTIRKNEWFIEKN